MAVRSQFLRARADSAMRIESPLSTDMQDFILQAAADEVKKNVMMPARAGLTDSLTAGHQQPEASVGSRVSYQSHVPEVHVTAGLSDRVMDVALSDPSDTMKDAMQRLEARMMKQENELELQRARMMKQENELELQRAIIKELNLRNGANTKGAAGAGESPQSFVERPHSMASYCIHVAMDPLEPTLEGILAMSQMCLLAFCQYALSHAFFDTAWLASYTGDLAPEYKMAEFYVAKGCPTCDAPKGFDRSLTWNCNGPDGFAAADCVWEPRISVMAALVAIFLLSSTAVMSDE